MPTIEVAPASLAALARALRTAADTAGVVALFGRGRVDVDGTVGSERVAASLAHFLKAWSHGASCLERDADTLAEMLAQAARCYAAVEASLTGGAQ